MKNIILSETVNDFWALPWSPEKTWAFLLMIIAFFVVIFLVVKGLSDLLALYHVNRQVPGVSVREAFSAAFADEQIFEDKPEQVLDIGLREDGNSYSVATTDGYFQYNYIVIPQRFQEGNAGIRVHESRIFKELFVGSEEDQQDILFAEVAMGGPEEIRRAVNKYFKHEFEVTHRHKAPVIDRR